MAPPNYEMASVTFGGQGAGFAKLQGENFGYYMANYSIILGRNSENSKVDLDLTKCGGRIKKVSRHHARIFYDFEHRHFALEVLGKHGCMVQGVTYRRGSDPVKLNSQDLIEIAGVKIYFLLPTRSISETIAAQRSTPLQAPNHLGHGKSKKRNKKSSGGGESSISNIHAAVSADSTGVPGERDNQRLLPKEEKDVVSSIATVISDLWEPGELVPMMDLQLELLGRFGKIWSQDDVSRYLAPEERPSTETRGKPWSKLSRLLKKHPEHFVVSTPRGEPRSEYVALVS